MIDTSLLRRLLVWLPVVLALFGSDSLTARGEEDGPHLIVALYVPSDIEFPRGAEERIGLTCEYAEKFLFTWMKHWDYPPAKKHLFDREANGRVRVYPMKSTFPLAEKAFDRPDPALSSEVSDALVPKYNLGRHKHYWWVWVYYTDPPAYFSKAHGYGDHRNGGAAFINYYSKFPGQINLGAEMGDGFNREMSLKASVHELGHAFGLPHTGPVRRDAGAPLMGATFDAYQQRTHVHEDRVCLSEASAAMLWKHPLFSGSSEERDRNAKFNVEDLEVRQAAPNRIVVHGRLTSDIPAHSVIVADDAPPDNDYWRKMYVARLDRDGAFQVNVTEPSGKDGRLRLLFCFDNGEVTGDGVHYDIDGGMPVPYRFANGKYHFEVDGRGVRGRKPVGASAK